MSESETVAKNRIEFQWGSKLQGTSSEALFWFVVMDRGGQDLLHRYQTQHDKTLAIGNLSLFFP